MTDLPLFAACRSTDPSTSREAADLMNRTGSAATHAALVYGVVADHPGLTYVEVAPRCGLEAVEVMRRLGDLQRRGMVRKGPVTRRCGGKAMSTWEVRP